MTQPGSQQPAPERENADATGAASGPGAPAQTPRGRRPRLRHLVFMLVPLLVTLLLAEIALGFYHHLHRYIARKYDFVAYVGWGTKENNQWVWENRPGFGRVEYSTKKHGFRSFGNLDTTATRILVLGDSFTEAYTVSDGKAYYNYIGRHADNVEVFAYGCGGYGTLQEYLVLDRHFDEIRPDIVIWQFCSNDLINNDFEMESASHINNKHMVRPYLIDGKIKWKYPRQDFGVAYRIVQHSYLLRLFDLRLSMLKGTAKYSIETVISPEHPWVVRSADTTSQILAMVRRRAGKARIVAFNTERRYFTGNNWVGGHYARICRDNGIDFLDTVPDALDAATSQGLKTNGAPFDPIHWNELGHEIVGRTLLRRLIDDKLVSGTIPSEYEAPIVKLDTAPASAPGQTVSR